MKFQSAAVITTVLSVAGKIYEANAGYTFASLGNWGFPSKFQTEVAESLKRYAEKERIAMIVSPGTNFKGGITSVDDPMWQTLFADVYGDDEGRLKVPFFTVLGVDDWAGNYNAEIEMSGRASEVIDSDKNIPQWTIPNWWYHFMTNFTTNEGTSLLGAGHEKYSVGFVFIDTWILSSQFPYTAISQKAWNDLKNTLEVAPKIFDFIIVVGDKPIFSSGASKGDTYLAYYLLPLLKQADVDAYIAGYDIQMEVIESDGLTQITCGTGAMSSTKYTTATGSLYYSGNPGFCVSELTPSGMVTKFVNGQTDEVEFTYKTPMKERPEKKYSKMNVIHLLPPVKFVPVPESMQMPTHESFIRVVGTIGILVDLVFLGLATAIGASKLIKKYGS